LAGGHINGEIKSGSFVDTNCIYDEPDDQTHCLLKLENYPPIAMMFGRNCKQY